MIARPFFFPAANSKRRGLAIGLLGLFAAAFAANRLAAEDVIDRKGATAPLRGNVSEINRTEVVLKGATISASTACRQTRSNACAGRESRPN